MKWVKNIIQIGARGLGSARPEDYDDAVSWGVNFIPMRALQNTSVDSALYAIPKDAKVFINLDIDVMDPAVVPSVIGPAPGGLNYWQIVDLLTAISKQATIAGFCLTELMPANDIGGRGALVAARVLTIAMGLISRQASS